MKILYLHQYFNTPAMPGGTRSYEMARRLVANGHEVHLITSRREGGVKGRNWEVTDEEGIVVHWLAIPYSNAMSYGKRIQAFFKFAIRAALRAARLGGDVVFATSTPLTIALPGAYAAWRRRIPMVFEVRDLWPELPIAVGALKNPFLIQAAKSLETFAYRNSEQIVALSPGMKDGILRKGFSADKIHVIPNSCDVNSFQVSEEAGQSFIKEHKYLQGGPLITYAGTLGIINGVDYLVRLAKAIIDRDPSVRFLIVGDGIRKNQVLEEARALGVENKNVWFLPQIPKKIIPRLMSATTVAVSSFIDLPEMWNNSANKFFDALAAGRPVMINYMGWQADLLQETGAGLVVPADNPDKGAAMLHDFLNSPDRLAFARKAALELANTSFNRQLHAKQLENVLKAAVDRL